MTTINEETRVVDFFFENIQLPDSVNNEPESHGLMSYAIAPYAGLDVGTELNNTAFIYFDNNDAIVTNTTWTTIHECGGEAVFEASVTEVCVGETVEFSSSYELVESYQWNVNSVNDNTEPSFSKTFEEAGEYIVQLVAVNPLCNASSMQMIIVYDLPVVEFTQDGDLLTASEGETYQWSLNGEEIEGAMAQEHSVTEDGTYSVEVTNGGICTAESEGIMIVGISELESETILLYPNPMIDRAYLEFEDSSTRTIRLLDVMGREVRIWENVNSQKIEIRREDLSIGNYTLVISDKNNSTSIKIIISQ
jgi:PKD repeat protein